MFIQFDKYYSDDYPEQFAYSHCQSYVNAVSCRQSYAFQRQYQTAFLGSELHGREKDKVGKETCACGYDDGLQEIYIYVYRLHYEQYLQATDNPRKSFQSKGFEEACFVIEVQVLYLLIYLP